MKQTMKTAHIATEHDLDKAIESLESKKKRDLRKDTKNQIVASLFLAALGLVLLSGRLGMDSEGGLLAAVNRVAGLLYLIWALSMLYAAIRKYRQKTWDHLTDGEKRIRKAQSGLGLVVINLIVFGPIVVTSLEAQSFRLVPALVFLTFLIGLNAFIIHVFRRDYQKWLQTYGEGN